MVVYKLHYFDIRGKGEIIRLVFAAAGVEYEDIRYEPPIPGVSSNNKSLPWNADTKATMPLGQMPVLEIDGQTFCQQSSTARFLARRFGLMGDDELQAFKVDMVVETMWPDVASKCTGLMFEKDEVKKAAMKEKLKQDMPNPLEKIACWVEGDFVLGEKLSLADLAIFDVAGILALLLPEVKLPAALQRVKENVAADKKVSKWLSDRPKTNF